jgi:hypothetical protein
LFKWLRKEEFCSPAHRESYHQRFRKVIEGLAVKASKTAEVAQPKASKTAPPHPLPPISAPYAATAAVMAPVLCTDCALRLRQHPDALFEIPDLLPQPDFADLVVEPVSMLPLSARSLRAPLEVLPSAFENYVRIKGWGLRLTLLKRRQPSA